MTLRLGYILIHELTSRHAREMKTSKIGTPGCKWACRTVVHNRNVPQPEKVCIHVTRFCVFTCASRRKYRVSNELFGEIQKQQVGENRREKPAEQGFAQDAHAR